MKNYPGDFDEGHISIIREVEDASMASPELLHAVIESVRYIIAREIPGAIVECGVWRGGTMLAAALALRSLECLDRELYLFDTFQGMPKPGPHDVNHHGESALEKFARLQTGADQSDWVCADIDDAKSVMSRANYEESLIHFIKGKVEDTIPAQAPEKIAFLHLDTDFYESTRHELQYLFPRLSPGAILIIDDYGHWKGARRATDEYFRETGEPVFLSRVDYTRRLVVKLPA